MNQRHDRDDDTTTTDDNPAITLALERFKLGVEARQKQREREKAALAFQVPDLQWPDDVKLTRKGQTIGGVPIPPRPMLSIPSLDQPTRLVLNQEKAAQLGVQVHPISEDATDETAETLQGLYRRIEVDSRAGLARSFAYERGVRAGTGEYEVTTEYDPDGGSKFDQKICIKRILYQGSIVRDPFAQEPDWSDGLWAFKPLDMAWDTYKKKYKNSKLAKYDTEALDSLAETQPDWIADTGAGRAIRIAAYYEIRVTNRTVVLLDDGSEAFEDEIPAGRTPMQGEHAKSGECEERKLWYSVINAIEELEPAAERDGRYIPLISYSAVELVPFDSERRWVGITEPNMDAARLINYSASSAVELAALETKAPYMLAEGQEEGHEQEFALANVRNFPYLRYRPVSLLGTPVPPPQRTQMDTGRLGPSMMLLQQGREFLHAGTGAFEAALGQASPQNKTKGGVLALQQQHDQGNSHFLDNLAEITLTYEAKVILDLIPHIYDRPGRIARILDKEDNPQTVMLNHPFTVDPKSKRPVKYQAPDPMMQGQAPPQGVPPQPGAVLGLSGPPAPQGPPQPEVKHFDLNKGRYGVTVSIGKSYKSRTEQGADELGQLFQAEPQLFQILGDIYLKFRDFPGHLEAAERVKKMLPPPLQAQDDPNKAQQELGQMKQQMEEIGQQLKQAAEIIKTDKVKYDAQVQIKQMEKELKIALQTMSDATSIRVAQINLMGKGVMAEHASEDEDIALGREHAFDAHQAEQDRQQEHALAQMAHERAMQQGAQQAGNQAALAEQGQQHALEQGQAGHEQALEQGQQAADLAPDPTVAE